MIKFIKDSYTVHRFRQNCGDESCCSWMEDDGFMLYEKDEEVYEEYINLDKSSDLEEGVDYIII
jgi:hypothetical protein